MKTIVLRNKQGGEIRDNNEIVYFNLDTEKRYPLRRIVKWALFQTNKLMGVDCAGMEGEGDWGIDTFWNYFRDFYPELINELSSDSEFEDILVENFSL